jgi:hypothetical protein
MICLAAIVATTACGGSKSTGPSSLPGSAGTLTAKINGTQFTSIATVALRNPATPVLPNGTVGVSGANKVTLPYTTLAFGVPAVVGTYRLETSSGPVPQNAAVSDIIAGSQAQGWNAGAAFGGSGFITLSTLTATGASGEFSFTAVALGSTGATGQKNVTEGKFDVKF